MSDAENPTYTGISVPSRSTSVYSSAVLFADVSLTLQKRTILDHIQLDIVQGRITGILGQNGSGKSTLLSLIAGLRVPSSGHVTVLGEMLPARGTDLRARLGVVFQETALYEELTVFENLQFFASLYAIENSVERVMQVLELLGLADRAHDRVATLSGGLGRRVAIARALLHDPELLLVDEPTLGVDVETRHALWAHLRLLRAQGRTIIVATNYLDEAIALCDTVAVLSHGRLLVHEPPAQLLARAGRCLDIECTPESSVRIQAALEHVEGVLHIERTVIGLAIFLQTSTPPDPLFRLAAAAAPILEYRLRAPDLSEIFHVLESDV